MTDKINTGRRWTANFATSPMPACVEGMDHGWPSRRDTKFWVERRIGRCIVDWTCQVCGLVVHVDSSD
jgi:hypothetical protein